MTTARLYGIRDLRVETVPTPEPKAGELLVAIEACGICPTDARKYEIGVRGEAYPHNPGHEWVGRVVGTGEGVTEWEIGSRVYGDTFVGYAEFATIATDRNEESYGPLRLPDDLPLERAIFIEPLADCFHAVKDQARVQANEHVVVVGGGPMGLQLVAASVDAGGHVLVVEPDQERRALAQSYGADIVTPPDGWQEQVANWTAGNGADAIILAIGVSDLLGEALVSAAHGARIVLFAGFGNSPQTAVDLNQIHYRELRIIGSEWVGVPPCPHHERYEDARNLLVSGKFPLELLVRERCGFSGLERAFDAVRTHRTLKAMLIPTKGAQ